MEDYLARKMNRNSIAKELFPICYDVTKRIGGASDNYAISLGRTGSIRFSHTTQAILRYAQKWNKRTLKIVNASGMASGAQDFSIVDFLRHKSNIEVEWSAFESPNSKYLENAIFKDYLTKMSIQLHLVDFSKESNPFKGHDAKSDIVLFTEIIEHLDYSVFLDSLRNIRTIMGEDAIMILTTPNLLRLANRIRFLIGSGDGGFFGDGRANLEKSLFGHIINYDLKRLGRLLGDAGYRIDYSYTFSYAKGIPNRSFLCIPIDFLSSFLPGARDTIFLVARKANPREIPFRI
jgi:hypothetical protein